MIKLCSDYQNDMSDQKATQSSTEPLFGLTPEVLAFLQKQHVHFLLPMYGGLCSSPTFLAFIEWTIMATKMNLKFVVDVISNESLITRGRNNLVAKFLLNKEATHMMFVDVDLGFKADAIFRLLLSNQDVVGGIYPMKTIPTKYCVNTLETFTLIDDDIVEVSTLGTGFMLVKRHVIEKMISAHPHLKYKDNLNFSAEAEPNMYALFDTLIDEHGNYLSEDWTFCYRWRKMGGKCFANIAIDLQHNGNHTFRGDTTILRERVLPNGITFAKLKQEAEEKAKAAAESKA